MKCSKNRGKKKMGDLIDRKEAVGAIKNEILSWLEGDSHDYRKVVDAIMDLPTVEAEPVRHGNWKPFDEDEYSCSVCGNIFVTMDGEHPLSNGFKYCPFCGAKMDERKEE